MAVLADQTRPAVRKAQWQILANSLFKRGALNFDLQEVSPPIPEAVDMTPEQIKELRDGIGADLKVNAAEAVSGAMAPVMERLSKLEDMVGKGEKAEVEALRAEVAEHIGEAGAAELSVNALKATLVKFNPGSTVDTGNLKVNRDSTPVFKRAEMPE